MTPSLPPDELPLDGEVFSANPPPKESPSPSVEVWPDSNTLREMRDLHLAMLRTKQVLTPEEEEYLASMPPIQDLTEEEKAYYKNRVLTPEEEANLAEMSDAIDRAWWKEEGKAYYEKWKRDNKLDDASEKPRRGRKKGQKPKVVPATVKAPKDWLTAPIWTPGIQRAGRSVEVFDHRTGQVNTWTLGIDNPISKKHEPSKEISIHHIKVALAVLSFWEGRNPVPMSVNELALRVANSRGGRYQQDLLDKLNDLRQYWVEVKNEKGRKDYFPLLQKIRLHKNPPRKAPDTVSEDEMWLDEIELDPKFADLLNDYSRSMDLNFETLRTIKSGMVQSIYLFLPSRAVHHAQEDPFKITTERLWQDLELDVAPKSVRKKALTQNNPSIMDQLDGLKLLSGVLRVSLEETVDKKDWNLLAWVEKGVHPIHSGGKLREAWLARGRSAEEFKTRIENVHNLEPYQFDNLEILEINLEKGELFFCHAKALLGDLVFDKILSEAKAEQLEGRSDVKNWEAVLRYRIEKAIS